MRATHLILRTTPLRPLSALGAMRARNSPLEGCPRIYGKRHTMWWVSLRTTSENSVMAKFIRKKVDVPGEPKLIRTVRGAGYTLKGA